MLEIGLDLHLTNRELDVLELIAINKNKKQMKEILHISTYQLNNLYQSLRDKEVLKSGKLTITIPAFENLLGRKAIEFIAHE